MSEPSSQPAQIAAADAIGRLAKFVLGEHSLDELLENVVDIAKCAMPGPPEVSITLVDGQPLTMAGSGPLAIEVDERQYDIGYGPCLDAVRLGEAIVVDDLTAETRWPEYVPRALKAGVAASLSLPLPIEDRHIGAMNIYFRQPGVLDDDALGTAQTIAGFAAVALVNADRYQKSETLAQQLAHALESRSIIDQAKGILMAEHHFSADDAFDMLVRLSQNTNHKLRDVAAALVKHTQRGR
jgi:GAF domain-containing protein